MTNENCWSALVRHYDACTLGDESDSGRVVRRCSVYRAQNGWLSLQGNRGIRCRSVLGAEHGRWQDWGPYADTPGLHYRHSRHQDGKENQIAMKCPHCNTPIDEHPASRCLDGWVAENVIGWETSPFGNWYWQMSPPIGSTGRAEGRVYNVPNYSTRILYAWQVVEKAEIISVCRAWDAGGELKGWTAWADDSSMSNASSPELAICRAAIKHSTT